MKKILILLTLSISFFTLLAVDVYINGVKVDDMKSQNLKNCEVKFDEKGDIHISSPDIKIVREGEVDKEYFASITLTGSSYEKELKLFINGKEVIKLEAGSKGTVSKITPHIKKGDNQIMIVAPPSKEKIGYNMIIGDGTEISGNLNLNPVINETSEFSSEGLSKQFIFKAE